MSKKRYYFFSIVGIIILSGLVCLNYTYPLTLGKTSILYSDYGKFYHSQRQFIAGKNIYSPVYFVTNKKHIVTGHSLLSGTSVKPKITALAGNLNPPLLTLLTFPIAYLSYPHALLFWTFLSILTGCIAILLLQQKIKPHLMRSLPTSLLVLIGFMCYFPTFVTLQFGQVSLLILLILVLGWRAAHDQKPTRAAVYLGIAASLKPFIGLFLFYFLIRKECRALLTFILIILISVLITTLFFGIDIYYSYYKTSQQIAWAATSWNVSIYGFLLRLIGGGEANTPLLSMPGLFKLSYIFLSLLLLLTLCWFLRPLTYSGNFQKKTDIDFSLILVTMLLLSPLGWMYYFPFLIIPFSILWNFSKEGVYPIGLPVLLITLLLISNIPITMVPTNKILPNNVVSVFLGSSVYFAILLTLMGLLFMVRFTLSQKSIKTKTLQVFENIPFSLLLLVWIIAFLPSLFGITKASSNWIRYAGNYSTEYTLISQD